MYFYLFYSFVYLSFVYFSYWHVIFHTSANFYGVMLTFCLLFSSFISYTTLLYYHQATTIILTHRNPWTCTCLRVVD